MSDRNLTAKTVTKGQGDSMIKGRQSAKKVAENKARVAAMNADPIGVVEVAEGRDGTKRAHRPTCKRRPADVFETTAHTAVVLHRAVAATCCKPVLPDYWGGTEPQPMAQPAPHGFAPAGASVPVEPTPEADTDPIRRLALAKAEHKTLQAWIKNGENPPRPATPNLDAVNAEHAARGGAPRTKVRTAANPTGRQHRNPRYTEAMARKKAGKRGAGLRITDEALQHYVADVLKADPDAVRNEELEVAYWLEGFAVTRSRWNNAWAATQPMAAAC